MGLRRKQWFGILLVVVALFICLGWTIQSLQARELVGSPFVWAIVLFGFFIGLWLAGQKDNENQPVQGLRKKLILYYLVIAVGLALAFLAVHIVVERPPLKPAQAYSPVIIMTVLISYIPFYLLWAIRSDVGRQSGVIMPILYLSGISLAPLAAIDTYNQHADQVEILSSPGQLSLAQSNFLQFQHLEVRPDKAIYDEYHHNDHGRHEVTFTAMLPVNTGRKDSLFDVWIWVQFDRTFDADLGEDSLKALERPLLADWRNQIDSFQTRRVVFYDKSKQQGYGRLRDINYPIARESLIILPVYTTLTEHRRGEVRFYLFLVGIITLFFWGITAISTNESE